MTEIPQPRLKLEDVVHERDVFKLAIRGHAAVEELINLTIADALGGTTPAELRRLSFPARLALMIAFTPLDDGAARPIAALAKLRNDFAHGDIETLTLDRARSLADVFRPAVPESAHEFLDSDSPLVILAACVTLAHALVDAGREAAQMIADRKEGALRLEADLKQLLDRHQGRS
jgi:hypothetical protein